jgi:hypothetical protein
MLNVVLNEDSCTAKSGNWSHLFVIQLKIDGKEAFCISKQNNSLIISL